jgi:hypothetical protein
MSATPTPATPDAPNPVISARQPGYFRRLWERWEERIPQFGEGQLFLLLAVIIGIFSGLGVVLFRIAI